MSDTGISGKIEILLVEDNPGDVVLFSEALDEMDVQTHLNIVEDGEAALSFLLHHEPFQYAPRPHLIILDLNLPRLNGREVLQAIRENPLLNHIPVIILTTSKSEKDMLEAYRLHANSYTVKPVDLQNFMKVLKDLIYYWLYIARLPINI